MNQEEIHVLGIWNSYTKVHSNQRYIIRVAGCNVEQLPHNRLLISGSIGVARSTCPIRISGGSRGRTVDIAIAIHRHVSKFAKLLREDGDVVGHDRMDLCW